MYIKIKIKQIYKMEINNNQKETFKKIISEYDFIYKSINLIENEIEKLTKKLNLLNNDLRKLRKEEKSWVETESSKLNISSKRFYEKILKET
jgi:DNA anti-recombination protein RmuC